MSFQLSKLAARLREPAQVARSLWIAKLAALALAQVALSSALRLLWLGRPDPFGNPLVGKIDWYWFHALALDSWQAFRVVTACVVVGLLAGQREFATKWVLRSASLVFVLLTMVGVLDGEVMRFLGMHVSPTLVHTYANAAAIRELPALLAKDAGVPYLGATLLVLAPIAVGVLGHLTVARVTTLRPALWLSGLALAGYCYAFLIWPGGFRQWRLSPPLDVTLTALHEAPPAELNPREIARANAEHAQRWTSGGDATHGFLLPDYPLFHVTDHIACVRGLVDARTCQRDSDGDRLPLLLDCDDRDATMYPGAPDPPSDGVDQDCDGIDQQPVNVLLLILETHRALNVGHLFPDPSRQSATPELDALTEHGVTLTRAVANGTPTVNAFMALHTSLLPHPTQTVASSFNHMRIVGLPQLLREHGYYARFFSAADPAWDNQTAWLRQWYDEFEYNRAREQDGPLFEHIAEWFEQDWPKLKQAGANTGKPFFVAVTTRTNHYPFHRVDGVETTGEDTLQDRIVDTMRYTDKHMGRLLARLAKQPWWNNTVVIVTGDHGFPMGEHGYSRLHETAQIEATGVPIVIAGGHPEVARLVGAKLNVPASHLDIAPTVLDLVGIEASGSFMGRSLLTALPARSAVTITAAEWALSRGDKRVLIRSPSDATSTPAPRWYDRLQDPQEHTRLNGNQLSPRDHSMERELSDVPPWMAYLYEHNRLWPSP